MRSSREDEMGKEGKLRVKNGTNQRKCEKAIHRKEERQIAAEANMQGQLMVSVGLK